MVFSSACMAQNPGLDSVPIWPADGNPGPELRNRYVFLSADRRTAVVLEPTTEGGVSGPKKIVKVPLGIGQEPAISLAVESSQSIPGALRYRYTLRNQPNAQDPIGTWSLIVPADPLSVTRVPRVTRDGRVLWVGGAARAVVAQQVGMKHAPLGRLVSWFHQTEDRINPGETVDGFEIESHFLPGFSTAFVASGKGPEFNQDWPAEIFQQLEFYNDRSFREPNVLTIGPSFRADSAQRERLANFEQGVSFLVKAGRLGPESKFVVELLAALHSSGTGMRISASPSTAIEKEIAAALRISLPTLISP